MGYTHYWYRPKVCDSNAFSSFYQDVKKLHQATKKEIPLAGLFGLDDPVFSLEGVFFNGPEKCKHPNNGEFEVKLPQIPSFTPFSVYCVNNNCSHESFYFPRIMAKEDRATVSKDGYFFFCKTAYKPYDVLVTASLISAHHYFGIKVCSDGDIEDWQNAIALCEHILGYGKNFHLDT